MVALLMGLCGCVCAAAGPNLVANPGFETAADQAGVPDGWRWAWQRTQSTDSAELAAGQQAPEVGFDGARAGGGRRCLKVAVARAADDGVWTQEGLAATPGATVYRISAWLKVAGARGGTAQIGLVFLGDENRWLGAVYDAISVREDCDWTRRTGYVGAPAGTRTMRLRIWTNMRRSGPITAWYDDLVVEATDLTNSAPTASPRPSAPAAAGRGRRSARLRGLAVAHHEARVRRQQAEPGRPRPAVDDRRLGRCAASRRRGREGPAGRHGAGVGHRAAGAGRDDSSRRHRAPAGALSGRRAGRATASAAFAAATCCPTARRVLDGEHCGW